MKKTICIIFILALLFAGCSAPAGENGAADASVLPGTDIALERSMDLAYADQFSVDYYEGGYKLLTVKQGDRFLLVPEGKEAPEGLAADIKVLQAPVGNIYMAASSCMALFDAMDSLDRILFSATRADGWYVENAKKAMEDGRILFAGKYSEPDYEGLIEGDCELALENTMLLHSPKVKDMIEQLGIPVLIEYSSYESHPLGRTEWIRFFGALLDREEAADAYFEKQAQQVRELEGSAVNGKKVGFFYIGTAGRVVVYSGASYIAKMVELAGGEYLFADVTDEDSGRSSVNITLEDFYAKASDADYLIYNATIDEPIYTLDQLLAKSDVLADVKAVREGNVWCTGKYMYQATDIIGDLILDIHRVLTDSTDGMAFLYKLQ
ncbi:MAG: ABC transporter substrate-binding protein [Firmicutes bacterium]|nr:ABC transporter substrate-binding protein [Bacillota bacterium]